MTLERVRGREPVPLQAAEEARERALLVLHACEGGRRNSVKPFESEVPCRPSVEMEPEPDPEMVPIDCQTEVPVDLFKRLLVLGQHAMQGQHCAHVSPRSGRAHLLHNPRAQEGQAQDPRQRPPLPFSKHARHQN